MGFWKSWEKVCIEALKHPDAPGIVWGKEEKLLQNQKNKNIVVDAEWQMLENKSGKDGRAQ